MRLEPPSSSTPGPQRSYSHAQLAQAAIEVADAEGLDGASMRRVAAKVGTGAMSLYSYVGSRGDLIELMIDAVTGEIDLPAPGTGDWRANLTLVAGQKRAMWLRHPWLAAHLRGHPIWGPNCLRVQEFMFAALHEFDLSPDKLISLIGLFDGYVESSLRTEIGWAEETRRTKTSAEEWMRLAAPHAAQIVAGGEYPIFAKILLETAIPHMSPADQFEYGLSVVLDSIGAKLRSGADGPARDIVST
jgi:AcrR family transcriptional regulator